MCAWSVTNPLTLLHVLPQNFILDGRAGYRRPQKRDGSRLEANVHAVTASAHEHQSLVAAVHLAHIGVEETVFEPVAASYACVHGGSATRGVACSTSDTNPQTS